MISALLDYIQKKNQTCTTLALKDFIAESLLNDDNHTNKGPLVYHEESSGQKMKREIDIDR